MTEKDSTTKKGRSLADSLSDEDRRRFNTLCHITEVINSSLEIEEVLDSVMEIVIEVMNAERGFIMLIEPESEKLLVVVARNIEKETIEGQNFQVSRSIIEEVIKTRKPVLTTDASTDQRFDGSVSVRLFGLHSVLCVPILYKHIPKGVIYLDNKFQVGVFTQKEMIMLESIANLAAIAIENARLFKSLQKSYKDAINALSNAILARDEYTRGHSEMVSYYSTLIAREIKLPDEMIQELNLASLLHDVGKIGISDTILLKPGSLSEEEKEALEKHARIGSDIIDPMEIPENVKKAIKHHQERYDGGGYPDGLKGEEIPLLARIIAAADAFHAMVSDRVYRKAMPFEEAKLELLHGSGMQFDPKIVATFLRIVEQKQPLPK